jgi:hypothetical protein
VKAVAKDYLKTIDASVKTAERGFALLSLTTPSAYVNI